MKPEDQKAIEREVYKRVSDARNRAADAPETKPGERKVVRMPARLRVVE